MSESPHGPRYAPPADLDGLQRLAFIAGGIGIVGCLAGAAMDAATFFHAYLIAYLFWLIIATGSLAWLMIHHLSGGAWGLMVRRPLEAAARTIPLMTLLFVPIVLGLPHLYEWSHPEAVAADPILQSKAPYLNSAFFVVRAAIYFAIWNALAYFLTRWSREQDQQFPPPPERKFRLVSGPGVLIYGFTISFASFDWVMSLDPHWYSTIFGLLFMVGTGLSGMAFVVVVYRYLEQRQPMADVFRTSNVHDLGKLLLAFVMLWAYLWFSQFLIIWSGNLAEEIPWYLRRFDNGWQIMSILLVALQFGVPFALLLSRDLKQKARRLVSVALLLLVMRYVDLYWLIVPQFRPESPMPHWMDAAALLGVGGVWLAVFVWQLRGQALLPVNDPYLHEALADGHH